MAERITQDWIVERIKKTIDQHFQESKWITDKKWLKNQRVHFLGGVFQTALHLLPTEKYFEIKQYCYDKYGYDPGGQSWDNPEQIYKEIYRGDTEYKQMTIDDWMEANL